MIYDFNIDHFFNEKYARYRKKYGVNLSMKDIYNFLSDPTSIDKMIKANDLGLPALAGVVKELENKFSNRTDIDLRKNEVRQLVGCMVEEIIHEFGYKSHVQRTIRNPGFFKSATNYEPHEASRKYIIVNKPTIEKAK